MAKVGPKDEKPFNPISEKVIAAVCSPVTSTVEEPVQAGTGAPRATPEVQPLPSLEPMSQHGTQRLQRTKRFKLSEAEEMDIERSVTRLAGALRVKVNFSHVSRCLWQLYLAHEDEILDRVRKHCHLTRPHNGDSQALAAFEEELVRAITQAITQAPRH